MADQIVPYPLAINTSDQDVDIPGDPTGIHNMVLAFDTPPSAGTVVVKYREPWTNTFTTLEHANGASLLSGPIFLRIDGPLAMVRVTFSGLVGGIGAKLWVSTQNYPIGVFNGLAAMMV